MKDLETLREQAVLWKVVSVTASFIQTCSFSIWVVIVLVVISAPFWAWIVAAFYILSHWFHYCTWLVAVKTHGDWTDANMNDAHDADTTAVGS